MGPIHMRNKSHITPRPIFSSLYVQIARDNANELSKGPVTDYSSTVTHWLRNRIPNYKGSYNGEAERPSASYIVDVSPFNFPMQGNKISYTDHW